ncbi:MAG TPA: winged helix-turn-helix transcriptional regulator [Firmicutes bacterium]|nr:winged helix-turn-helix transcriptional regulator [Bacillota bacterium]HHY98494.1 winged helix-turn-helix transcriptional regulator [Bacillota bacterium]
MENIRRDYERAREGADLLKVLAHPVRLCIVRGLLATGECNVKKMQECLDSPQSTISQHLGKLRAAGILEGRRAGVEIYYRLISEDARKVVEALFDGDH